MLKIQNLNQLIKGMARTLPKQSQKRFLGGLQVLAFTRYKSLNAAGRQLSENPNTGLSRIYRICQDERLAGAIETALLKLVFGRRKGWVRINIDHVTIGNFTIAVLALQTGRGRALPFWVQVNQGPRNAAIEPLIDKLTRLLDRLAGSYPKLRIRLVGDRWFASERLMRLCQDKGITFVFRTKTDKLVQTPWGKVSIGEIANYDTLIEYKGIEMRLIISDLRPGMKEAWFLLTNDFGRSRQGLLCQYERRWEIETTFKDVKNTQDLDPCRLRQTQSLRNVLLFACCGWVLFWTAVSKRQLFAVLNRTHSHKRLSWFNYLFEWLQRQLSRPLIPT